MIQDKTKLIVAAFIINPNGTILNAAKSAVSDNVGVGSIENDATEVSAEYFNLSGMRVAAPAAGMYIKVAKMSDGTTRTSKSRCPLIHQSNPGRGSNLKRCGHSE